MLILRSSIVLNLNMPCNIMLLSWIPGVRNRQVSVSELFLNIKLLVNFDVCSLGWELALGK